VYGIHGCLWNKTLFMENKLVLENVHGCNWYMYTKLIMGMHILLESSHAVIKGTHSCLRNKLLFRKDIIDQ